MTVLWIDEDYGDFPSLRRKIERGVGPVSCVYSIAEAIDWLKDNHARVSCLLLDAIVLLGLAGSEGVAPDTAKWLRDNAPDLWPYYGSLILKKFKELACRTIVLSIVHEDTLRREGFGVAKEIFWKGDLGQGADDLVERMNAVAEGWRESLAEQGEA